MRIAKIRAPKPLPANMFEIAAAEARGIREGGLTGQRVHVPEAVDVAAIRGSLELSQAEFAACFGFTKRAVQQWEQGHRRPEGPARVLLTMAATDPAGVYKILKKAGLVTKSA